MSNPRTLHCYDYVPVAYANVRQALRRDALVIFQRATQSAAARADEMVMHLQAGVGPIDVGVDAKIEIRGVTEEINALGDKTTRIEIGWSAAAHTGLFPSMDAVLSLYSLAPQETQLDLEGKYRPPLGVLGNALDALVGHRIAEAAVLRFLRDVSVYLASVLKAPPAS